MKKVNANTAGVVLLALAFGFSVLRYQNLQRMLGEGTAGVDVEGGPKVIRVLHWQLEPGYREALQDVMDEYNQLPHVKAEGVRVMQLPIPERVYSQFLNVHLISGTAPDICVKGMSSMVGNSSALARFFDPMSEFVGEPNPYNQGDYLREDLSSEMKELLSTLPWSDTFTDGMVAGWDESNQDYFAVPVSSWGAIRVFYNRKLVAGIKEFMREQWKQEPAPEWKTEALETFSFLEPNGEFLSWLATPDAPDSLGRLLVFCEATLAYAQERGQEKLVPISASNYQLGQFAPEYRLPFTYSMVDAVNGNRDGGISSVEVFGSWQAGKWPLDDPGLGAFYDITRVFPRYFPAGFLGLDREQAHRRFVLGNAVFLATGGWDANSIFVGAREHSDPDVAFDVGVMPYPMPLPGERWYEQYSGKPTEAGKGLGVPMAINKQSQNKEWAVDFLRFLTSHRVNERFNEIAAWLPVIVGAEPVEAMKPFQAEMDGLPPQMNVNLWLGGQLGTLIRGQYLLYFAGGIDLEEFRATVKEMIENPRYGVDRVWHDQRISNRDRSRQYDRALDVRILADDAFGDQSLGRVVNLFEGSLLLRDGKGVELEHHRLLPDQPFPEF